MAGISKPQRGAVSHENKKIGYLSQNPMANFLYDTVREELYGAKQTVDNKQFEEDMQRLIMLFELEHLLEQHPYDCSGGERQKIAMVSVLTFQT